MSEQKKTKTRHYHLVGKPNGSSPGNERIVEATSAAQALSHAAKTDWEVGVLSIPDSLRLAREGVETEVATAALPAQGDIFDPANPGQ